MVPFLHGRELQGGVVNMGFDWKCGELATGLQCYRREQFFEAHEHWEAVWLRSKEPEKTFLQALIQVTAAFHHLQRRNQRGAISLLHRALKRLMPYPPRFGGLAVNPLRQDIASWIRTLERDGMPVHGQFPRIQPDIADHEAGSV
jgi:uncharacterized protein